MEADSAWPDFRKAPALPVLECPDSWLLRSGFWIKHMETIILIGIQGSGKSTFYRQRFGDTHVRINLDMLKTRQREWAFVKTCLATRQRFVVDNTNPTAADRQRYILAARRVGFQVIGYLFKTSLEDALRRNALRTGRAVIPAKGVIAAARRLEAPRYSQGFDELFSVSVQDEGFVVRRIEPDESD